MAEPPITRPGDLVGRSSDGSVRIDRVIPLQWVLGMLGVVIAQAATLWFQVQAGTEAIKEVKVELRAMSSWQSQALVKGAEVDSDIRELRRRIEALEQHSRGRP